MNVGALASSCHSLAYVRWAEERLGPARERALGEDAGTIANLVTTHEAFARLQLLAFLFADEDRARASSDRDLAELDPSDVDDGLAFEAAKSIGAAAEVLRAATELEMPLVARLAQATSAPRSLSFPRIEALAPELAGFEVQHVRALGIRGRAYARVILVGVPGIAGVDDEHVSWQAAHEAIVASQPRGASFVDVERNAVATLGARA